MKRIMYLSVTAIVLALNACGGGDSEPEGAVTTENIEELTSIAFAEEAYDFGSVTQGEKVTHTFEFKNTGDADLVIVSAKGSCGCTVPSWPKEPIAPGATGVVEVVFSSEGKKGKQHKRVSIVANTEPATTVIALKGDVLAPEDEPAATNEEPATTEEPNEETEI